MVQIGPASMGQENSRGRECVCPIASTLAVPWEVPLVHAVGPTIPGLDFMFKGQDWKSGGPKFCFWLCSRRTVNL